MDVAPARWTFRDGFPNDAWLSQTVGHPCPDQPGTLERLVGRDEEEKGEDLAGRDSWIRPVHHDGFSFRKKNPPGRFVRPGG